MSRKMRAPSIANDHYASNPLAFDAVALMQHRLQAMGGAGLGAPGAGAGSGSR
eukprot:COSAG04_NODE_1597_length_6202_cov_14.561527_3_plen_52_part_01